MLKQHNWIRTRRKIAKIEKSKRHWILPLTQVSFEVKKKKKEGDLYTLKRQKAFKRQKTLESQRNLMQDRIMICETPTLRMFVWDVYRLLLDHIQVEICVI